MGWFCRDFRAESGAEVPARPDRLPCRQEISTALYTHATMGHAKRRFPASPHRILFAALHFAPRKPIIAFYRH